MDPHLLHPGVVCQAWARPGTQRRGQQLSLPSGLLSCPPGLELEGSPHPFWCQLRAIKLAISQLQLGPQMPLLLLPHDSHILARSCSVCVGGGGGLPGKERAQDALELLRHRTPLKV